MKRLIIVVALSLSFALAGAQTKGNSSDLDKFRIGAEIGFGGSSMRYSSDRYMDYQRSNLFSGMGGLYFDWNFVDNLSLRPYVGLVGRGVGMSNDDQNIDYYLKSKYVDFRLPLVYTFHRGRGLSPYVAAGPSLSLARGGKIHYSATPTGNPSYDLSLGDGNFRNLDYGLYLGTGLDVNVSIGDFDFIVGLALGYTRGFANTFSKNELSGKSKAVNIPLFDTIGGDNPLYTISGTRKNGNLTAGVNVAIPLSSIFGRKSKKPVRTPVVVPAPEPVPPVTRAEEPVVEPVVEPEPEPVKPALPVEQKRCCSIDEMYEYILAGEDISDKKICAFSDLKFEFNKAVLSVESMMYLNKLVLILRKLPNMKMSINGHTDNIGTREYNLKLSQRRAEAVYNYLIQFGIAPNRLRCIGFGSTQPLTDNYDDAARAMNRRVEFDLIDGDF